MKIALARLVYVAGMLLVTWSLMQWAPGRAFGQAPWWAKFDRNFACDAMRDRNDFYRAVREGAYSRALAKGRRVLADGKGDDRFALDVAYVMLHTGLNGEASQELSSLEQSRDAGVASAAARQLGVLGSGSSAQDLQEAYSAARNSQHERALLLLSEYLAQSPRDERARLQYAYELTACGRTSEARELLGELRASSDLAIARAASAQLAQSAPARAGTSVYGYGIHEGRFADTVYALDVRRPIGGAASHVYAVIHLTNDTRSAPDAGAPQVFNDDAAVAGAGIAARIGRYGQAFAETGYSAGLRGQRSFPEARAGVAFAAQSDGKGRRAHSAVSSSLVYYSRFAGNAIAYSTAEHDFRLSGSVRGIVTASLGADAHRLYYNNYLEAAAGVRARVSPQTVLTVQAVRGNYLARGLQTLAASSYTSIRSALTFGLNLP